MALGSYTALVAVCLNDQLRPGKGQFSVRRGAHEAVQAFFRSQRAKGGPIGGGGPDWPRLQPIGEDDAFAGIMPPAMVASYPDTRFEDEHWPWPELTPVLMEEGDAVIALHALPHTATPNLSDDPRMNVFFRIRRYRPAIRTRAINGSAGGCRIIPDRALNGDFLEYAGDYDPFKASVDKMCDHWSDFDFSEILIRLTPSLAPGGGFADGGCG